MVLPKCVLVLVFTLPKRTKRTRSKHPFSPMYLSFLICAQYLCLPHQNVQSKEPAMHNLSSPLLFLRKLCTGALLCTNLPPAFFGTVQWIVNDFTLVQTFQNYSITVLYYMACASKSQETGTQTSSFKYYDYTVAIL